MKVCNQCHSTYPNNLYQCPGCGATQYQYQCDNCGTYFQTPSCPNCGAVPAQAPGAQYAPGQQAPNYQQNTYVNVQPYGKPINKWTAFLLCFFLGFLGVHKFYEGKIGMGILYLFTGGLFGIGWFVDWIVILTKPNPYYVN
ncbi:MAG: NINE protein [Clostridiales bacterium]|nr:NINE protein [Clostridiales bacterium]